MLACVDTSESNYEETLNTLRHATRLYNRQEALDESEYLRAQVSRLRMQVSLLSDVQSNRDMEIQVKSLKEEMNAVRSYVRNLTDELVQIKSEKETLIFQNDNEDIQTHPIIQGYVQQVQNLKLQVAQTQMQLESALRHRPTSLLKQFSSSSSLLSKRFASASTLDLRRSISKPHRGSTSSGRRPPKRRFGSKPKVVYTPLHKARKSQPNLTDNIDEFIDRLQKEYEKSTDEIVLDDDQELSFEDFSFPSFTEQIDDNPMSPQIYPSHSETLLMNEDKLEALSVPAWSDEFKDSVTKRTSISVESMWDDTDSSITTSYVNSTIETPTISTSYKNDRKQNRKLLKMLHQSQADFLVKRELVGQLEKSEDLYTQMRSSYESKLNELKQHLLEIEKQRDVALKRNPKSPTPTGERPQSGLKLRENKQAQELRLEYEVKLKHLIAENQELRKKNTHLTQTSRTARVKADSIICQLQQDIETLTIQKKRLNRNLKIEMDSAKEASIVYEREIHQLKRKEAAALDAKNKLEEENETKSQLAKKRSEETATANAQMRQLTNTLRKAANAGTFLNEANLEKLLNGIPVATKTKRRSTIGAANPPIINLRKNESPSFV
ncbi:hypothetical protein G6F56_005928 [Rhizopus delemar]|nr:hypothetical protein G6F56_005928 [Rhizopus delemar]